MCEMNAGKHIYSVWTLSTVGLHKLKKVQKRSPLLPGIFLIVDANNKVTCGNNLICWCCYWSL